MKCDYLKWEAEESFFTTNDIRAEVALYLIELKWRNSVQANEHLIN